MARRRRWRRFCGCKPTWLEIEPGGGGEGEKKDPRKDKELRKENCG